MCLLDGERKRKLMIEVQDSYILILRLRHLTLTHGHGNDMISERRLNSRGSYESPLA